jgi:small-conductance mechanosensitive channel
MNLWTRISDILADIFSNILRWTEEIVGAYAPGLLAALLTLVLGWVVAALLRNVSAKLLRALGLDVVAERSGVRDWLRRHEIQIAPSAMVGWTLYFVVLFTVLGMAFEQMNLHAPARLLREVAAFIPKLIVVGVIIALGVFLARWMGGMASRAVRLAGVPMYSLFGAAVRIGVILLSVVVALDYLELASRELLLAGLGLLALICVLIAGLFALCARELVGNVLAKNFVAGEYLPGDRVRVGDVEGEVESVGTLAVKLRTAYGSCLVPNSRLLHETVFRTHRAAPPAPPPPPPPALPTPQ